MRYMPEGWLMCRPENLAAMQSCDTLIRAADARQILEARAILCDGSHNLIVDLGCMKGIILREECSIGIAEGSVRDIAIISRVGKPVCFFIQKITDDHRGVPYALLSRRAVQEQYADECLSCLIPGDIIDGRVTHLEPFGAFVDIGCGIPSLIKIDAISVSRISHPRDRLAVDMDIRAVVSDIDGGGRVSLSHRELLGTWSENAAFFRPGETVTGIVRSVEDYGVFVELTPNLAGLADPREGCFIGCGVSVYVKSIIPERMKIKLVLVDMFRINEPPPPPRYIFTGDHMDRFIYSPPMADRTIESIFS